MKLWDQLLGLVGLSPVPAAAPDATRRMAEAAGATIDADEHEWRRITGDPGRDLNPITQQRMRELAIYLWRANPLANRMTELPLGYILGEGVRLSAKDPVLQGWLDEFWTDPINAMAKKLVKRMRELSLFGEACWPVFVNDVSGAVRLGYLDPGRIETVVMDPDNPEQPIGIITCRDRKGRALRYRVIVNGDETVFTSRTQEIRATFTDGECFWFKVNDLCTSERGAADALAVMDWLDGYDQFLFGDLERASFMRAFVWDVTLTGATQDEVEARAKKITPPKPGSMRVHNDSEVWAAVAPDLKAQDTAETARLFRNHVLGGQTLPEHWYGGGGDVNRNAASEMGDPTFKMFGMRQMEVRAILMEVATYVVRQREQHGSKIPAPAEWGLDVVFPEMVARDITRNGAALQQTVAACDAAINAKLMTRSTAVKLIAAVAARLGVSIDPEQELNAAAEEAEARDETDRIEEPPIGGDTVGGDTLDGNDSRDAA